MVLNSRLDNLGIENLIWDGNLELTKDKIITLNDDIDKYRYLNFIIGDWTQDSSSHFIPVISLSVEGGITFINPENNNDTMSEQYHTFEVVCLKKISNNKIKCIYFRALPDIGSGCYLFKIYGYR